MSTERTQLLADKPGMFVCVQMFVQDLFVCVCACVYRFADLCHVKRI